MSEMKIASNKILLLAALAIAIAISGCVATGTPGKGQPTFDYIFLIYPLLAGIFILAIAFMASKIFNLPHWTPIIGDELVQILATGVVALLLVGMQVGIDGYLANALQASGQTLPASCTGNMIGCANGAAYDKLSSLGFENVYNELAGSSIGVGMEASKGIYCSFLGVGFTLSNCGQLNAFRGSLTASAFTVVAALTDVYAQQYILTLARNFAFPLLIPLGLFFRCFKLSRQAGGALIAVGFGFYTAYPLVIIAMTNLLTNLGSGAIIPEPAQPAPPTLEPTPHTTLSPDHECAGSPDCKGKVGSDCTSTPGCGWVGVCDPFATDTSDLRAQFDSYSAALVDPAVTQGLTYAVLVKGIFMSILNLIITIGFVRLLAHLLGSDIDFSAISRIS